ncbi:MAG: hypothetical protein ACRDZ5_09220 [Acidimicrobiales bacterium]
MEEAIENAPEGTTEEVYQAVTTGPQQVLEDKRREVRRRLDPVRRASEGRVEPRLRSERGAAI